MISVDFQRSQNYRDVVVPAWIAGTQINTKVFGRVLRVSMPAIRAGMTLVML